MIKKKQLLFYCVIFISLFSCRVNEEDAIGFYVSQNNVNTIDSLWINQDGSYTNVLYRKSDNSLVYKNVGTWEYSDGYIIFNGFYSENDDIHSKQEGNFEDVLMRTKLQLNKKNGNVIIRHKSMYDNIYFEKQ